MCRKSKRFSIVGQSGLKYVNFSANNHFKVGVDVCHWTIDKKYTGDVTVECSDGSIHKVKSGKEIYDFSKVDKQILKVYEGVMNHTVSLNKSNNRMFIRNNHGPAFSDKKTEEHIYPTYSNNRGIEKIIIFFFLYLVFDVAFNLSQSVYHRQCRMAPGPRLLRLVRERANSRPSRGRGKAAGA